MIHPHNYKGRVRDMQLRLYDVLQILTDSMILRVD